MDKEIPPTDEELAKNWQITPGFSDHCVQWMVVILSVFYDFSAAFISLIDVTFFFSNGTI